MAKKHTTTIEINGRRYDAITGAIVHDPSAVTTRPIDDVIRVAHTVGASARPATVASKALPTPPKPKSPTSPRTTHHAKAHQPQHGKTLMRQAVSKPRPSFKRQTKAVTRTDILAKAPQLQVVPKWSFTNIDPQRLKHAERVAKSRLITKFAPSEPTYTPSSYAAAIPLPNHSTTPVIPKPAHRTGAQPASHTTRSMDIFQRALTHATAHEQPPVHPKKLARLQRSTSRPKRPAAHRRTITLATTALAVVLLTGFIAYQNKANLTLRVASAAAGFHATLPGYKPSGFAIANFKYSVGNVAVNFHNAQTNTSYSLTQKNSNWDSQTLLDSYVATKSHAYQTLQSGGRTIYIYGNNDAAWVNNGIMYQVSSNGSLSTSDVLGIATSM